MSKKSKKSYLDDYLKEEVSNNKEKEEKKEEGKKEDWSGDLQEIFQEVEEYKETFELSSYYNVRLTDENYQLLKQLKSTNVSMVHFTNLLLKKVLKSKNFKNYIKKSSGL